MAEFSQEVIDAAAREREVRLTTFGRTTGAARQVVIWVSGGERRLFVRSGGGPGRHWTRNVLARPEGVLHVGGLDVPVTFRHLDPGAARAVSDLVSRKYGVRRPEPDDPPTAAETATFELSPRGG
jgi:hypothetical protein